MSENTQKLNIVDENDNVIGIERRDVIHREGLLHREIHVWFFTPKGEILFQHRAKDKDTYPDLLDATVGGHVEIGDSYEDTALKETKEETGINLNKEDLIFIKKYQNGSRDMVTGLTNNSYKFEFAFRFNGNISDLKIEEGKSLGFEAYKIDDVINSTSEEFRKKFIPGILKPEVFAIFEEIKKLI
jgi:isopentenyl-diphosphate delta-isomerase